MECKKHVKPIKSEMQLKLYIPQCILKAASLLFFFFFWQIIQDFLFVDQDAIPCVKGLETIVLMTTVK